MMEIAALIGVLVLGVYAVASYQEHHYSKKHKKHKKN